MGCRDANYFLLFCLIIVTYFLYKESTDNNRLYKICVDQDETIYFQSEAIAQQNLYINLLNSKNNNKPLYSPIH